MRHGLWHRLRALLLVVTLGVATGWVVLPTGAMATDMAMSAAMDQHDCGGCGGDDGTVDFEHCLSVCWVSVPALLPGELAAPMALPVKESLILADSLPGSPGHHPDPDPPKSFILG